MALIGTQKKLADDITKILKNKAGVNQCSMKMTEADSSGNTKEKSYAMAGGEGTCTSKTMKDIKTGGGINMSNVTGAEAMAAVIADQVISHILKNFELAALPRLDKLEDDYNNLLIGLTVAGTAGAAVPTTSGVGAALLAAAIQGGTTTRATKTISLRGKEKAKTKGGQLL